MTERHGLDTFWTPTLPISSMGHPRLSLAIHLRISAKTEGVSTLQQSPFFPAADKICALWKAKGKSNPDLP